MLGFDVREPAVQIKEFHQLDLADPASVEAAVVSIDGWVAALFNVADVSSGIRCW